MDSVLNFVTKYYLVDGCIAAMGLFGGYLIVDRIKALYFDLSIDSNQFMSVVMGLLRENKVEEAITFCGTNDKKPIAHVVKRILEKSNCDERDMHHAWDTAAAEIAPVMMKRLGHLAMASNVVTLIGLLGTVIGLIMAFKAVSFADPSQKQTLLADGISLAMHATALGLIVAIPVMIFYSFLHDKQTQLFGEIDRCAGQVTEFMHLRTYTPFVQENVFPDLQSGALAQKTKPTPPTTNHRAS